MHKEGLISLLTTMTRTMDIPSKRRSLTPPNVAWLRRNLPIRNSDHRYFEKAMEAIKLLEESYVSKG